MILRDDANQYNSLYHLSLRWARADTNSFTYEDFVQSFNTAISRVTAIIHRHDEAWPFHDKNASGNLIDTSLTLTTTSEYTISEPWLKIAQVRILKSDAVTWEKLEFINNDVVTDEDRVANYVKGYNLRGNKLYLVGTPNYTVANGIEITYQDGPTHVTPDAGDYTKEVGYNSLFEELGALMPALDYLEINGPDEQAKKVEKRIGIEPRRGVEGSGLLNSLAVSYQERNDSPQKLSLHRNNSASVALTDTYSGYNPLY